MTVYFGAGAFGEGPSSTSSLPLFLLWIQSQPEHPFIQRTPSPTWPPSTWWLPRFQEQNCSTLGHTVCRYSPAVSLWKRNVCNHRRWEMLRIWVEHKHSPLLLQSHFILDVLLFYMQDSELSEFGVCLHPHRQDEPVVLTTRKLCDAPGLLFSWIDTQNHPWKPE